VRRYFGGTLEVNELRFAAWTLTVFPGRMTGHGRGGSGKAAARGGIDVELTKEEERCAVVEIRLRKVPGHHHCDRAGHGVHVIYAPRPIGPAGGSRLSPSPLAAGTG